MVEFVSDSSNSSTPDDLLHASKLKKSQTPLDSLDSEADDNSFADSFLDYESIKDWIEELTSPDMDDAEAAVIEAGKRMDSTVEGCFNKRSAPVFNPNVEKSGPIEADVEPVVVGSARTGLQASCEKSEESTELKCIIQEGMSKVSLFSGSVNSVLAGELECHEDDSGSDGESEGSSLASTSSSSSSDASSSSEDEVENSMSSSTGNTGSDDEELDFVVNVGRDGEIGDFEEGEIRDVDVAEMPGGTDNDNENEDVSADHMVAWTDDSDGNHEEDDGESGVKGGPITSKNEIKVLPPVPQVYATIEPHHQKLPMGVVLSIIGNQVIVDGVEKHDPLSEGSVLWITESNLPLGLIDEIFGPVKNPYYSVRYNSEKEIPSGIRGGTHISFVPEFANHVLRNKDLYKKGYDASGVNDEELSDNEEFSDDEKELECRRLRRLAKRAVNDQHENRNNSRKKKNSPHVRKFGQPTSQHAKVPETRKYGQPTSQPAKMAEEPSKLDQPQQPKIDMVQPAIQNQHGVPHLPSFVGGCPNSSAVGQCFSNGTGGAPSFPPTYNPFFNPTLNGIWPSEMPFQQQQQNPFFPNGPPMNGMPWLSQNPAMQSPQMPMVNTFTGLPYPQGLVGGTLPCVSNPLTHVVEQGIHPAGLQFGQNPNLRPPFAMPGNMGATQQFNPGNMHPPVAFPGNAIAPQQFNQGASSRQGRKPYGRGGPHFRGRRGQRKP